MTLVQCTKCTKVVIIPNAANWTLWIIHILARRSPLSSRRELCFQKITLCEPQKWFPQTGSIWMINYDKLGKHENESYIKSKRFLSTWTWKRKRKRGHGDVSIVPQKIYLSLHPCINISMIYSSILFSTPKLFYWGPLPSLLRPRGP